MPTPSQPTSSSSNRSPYPLQENNEGFACTTDHGFVYQLAFRSDQSYFPDDSFDEYLYSFSIISVGMRTLVRDPRIELTVVYTLKQAFAANPQLIISYVCSLDNEMERHRRILFGQWYQRHSEGYTRLPFSYEQSRVYAAAIFLKDHPAQEAIFAAFNRVYNAK
jgi:hypothetical protein